MHVTVFWHVCLTNRKIIAMILYVIVRANLMAMCVCMQILSEKRF